MNIPLMEHKRGNRNGDISNHIAEPTIYNERHNRNRDSAKCAQIVERHTTNAYVLLLRTIVGKCIIINIFMSFCEPTFQ